MAYPKIYAVNLGGMTFSDPWSNTNASYPITNLSTYFETDQWRASSTTNNRTIDVDLGAATECDTVIIANSNIRSMTDVYIVAGNASDYSDGASPTGGTSLQSATRTAYNSTADVFEFTATTKRYWRLVFANTNSLTPQVGQLWFGKKLSFESNYEPGAQRGNPSYNTSVETSLSGATRTAQAYAGKQLYKLKFRLQSGTFRTAYQTFESTVRGRLRPFYFLDQDGTLVYVHLSQDYVPISDFRYNQNDVETLDMETQQATF